MPAKAFTARLAALEALEVERAAPPALPELSGDWPDYWFQCMLCGNINDPRRVSGCRCGWCGGLEFDSATGQRVAPHFTCPNCGDEHGQAARPASEWNRAGACSACGYAPPPSGDDENAYIAWARAHGIDLSQP